MAATADHQDDLSTVPESGSDAEELPARAAPRQLYSAAEDAALAAAVHAWHADGEAVRRYRSSWRGGAARLTCWDSVAALASARTRLQRSGNSASCRFSWLLARGLATLPPGHVSSAQAWALRDNPAAAAALHLPFASAAAAAAPAAPASSSRKRPRVQKGAAAAAAAAAREEEHEEEEEEKAEEEPRGKSGPKPKPAAPEEEEEEEEEDEEGLEEGAAAQGSLAWSGAEEAHLSALLARFPRHGDPKGGSADRGSAVWRNQAFWERMAAVLGSEGSSGRTAVAVYRKALLLRR